MLQILILKVIVFYDNSTWLYEKFHVFLIDIIILLI